MQPRPAPLPPRKEGNSIMGEVIFVIGVLCIIGAIWIYSNKDDGVYSRVKNEVMDIKADMLTKDDLEKFLIKIEPLITQTCNASLRLFEDRADRTVDEVNRLKKEFEVINMRFHNAEKALAGKNQNINVQIYDRRPKVKAPNKISGKGVGSLIPAAVKKAAKVNQ